MTPIPAKHIEKPLFMPIQISGFSATGVDDVITAAVTTALTTAGAGGTSLPLQVEGTAPTGQGLAVTAPSHRAEIKNSDNGDDILGPSNNTVYGKVTHAAGVYTLSYFYRDNAGAEQAYSFASATNIAFTFNYLTNFGNIPNDVLIRQITQVMGGDPTAGATARPVVELLTPTATNTLPNLAFTPINNNNPILFVNSTIQTSQAGDFAVAAKAITWNQATAKFDLLTTDKVVAYYHTNE
jgi:hypothetical protein